MNNSNKEESSSLSLRDVRNSLLRIGKSMSLASLGAFTVGICMSIYMDITDNKKKGGQRWG